MTFQDNFALGKYLGVATLLDQRTEELAAAYERINELKLSLAEMVGIYWGEGDGIEPAPQCIQRAWAALAEDVR